MATEYVTCPHCGAGNLPTAEWCIRCYSVLPEDSISAPAIIEPLEAAAPPRSGAPYWECRRCGESNPMHADRCLTCDAVIFDSFGPAEAERQAVAPRTALRQSLWFPGFGLRAAGDPALAVMVGFVAAVMIGIAVIEFSIDRGGFGAVLLAMTVGLWAVSARDAYVLAATRERRELWLRPRVLTLIGGVVGLVLFLTVAEAIRIAQEAS